MSFDSTIYIVKFDEINGRIITEDYDFLIQLREKLSFFADGYRFHPSFKNKFWDGKVRLLNNDGTFSLGLWCEIVDFCKRMDHPYQLDPKIRKFQLDREKFQSFVNSLDVHSGGEKIEPYDYQVNAAHKALEWQRCILLSPTSSGKSLIQYILVNMYQRLMPNEQMLMIVPTVALVSQMKNDFKDYSSEIDWDGDNEIHGITAGVDKETNKRIVISTYQSLTKVKAEYFEKFKAVMVDEVHTAKSKSIVNILSKCINAKWRVGLTGTLDECKTNILTLKGLFGPIFEVISTKELMDMGSVAQLKVHVGILKHKEEDCKHLRSGKHGDSDKKKKASYMEEIDFITTHKDRNRFIMNFTSKLAGNSILMVNKVEHGQNLYKWMTDVYPDRDIFLYTGSTKKEERDHIRTAMEQSENAIIIGSLGVLSTGISIKRLHNLVFAHPSKSRIKVLQTVGRLLRKSKFGNNVFMYDLVDDFRVGAYCNYTYEHGQKRVSFYSEQEFDWNVNEISI